MPAKLPDRISWPHAPLHELSAHGTYFLTAYEKSYLARLNYVHQNPVRHGLVAVANQYPWCSARWFERVAKPSQIKAIYGFNTDKLRIFDEYDVALEW